MATLTGSGGFTWTTSSSNVSTSASGYDNTYDSGLALYHNLPGFMTQFFVSTETAEDGGREIVYGPQASNGVNITRKQYIPTDQPFARFLEIFTNTSGVSKTFTVEIRSNFYPDSATVVTATSSGDTAVTAADKWIVVGDNDTNSYDIPAAAHVFAGTGAAVQPSAVTLAAGDDDGNYSFSITLAPGQTRTILHFASLANDALTAAANAAALAALPAYALAGMSTDELASVANFNTGYVFKSASYTLAVAELNLVLTGSANINGTGNALANTIVGNSGNNVLNGGAGNDTLNGGAGIDTASYAGAAAVTVNLALAGAQPTGSAGSDTLISIENLTGGAFNDTLTGNGGNNVLDGGVGADTMAGGLGNDTYGVNSTLDVVTEALNAGTDLVQSTALAHTLAANVENLTLLGTASINGTGNTLNNILTGNSGNNVLNGSTGTDTASYAAAGAAVTLNLGLAGAQNTGAAGSDTLISIENLTGSAFNDTLRGSSGNNVLDGGAGTDTLIGGLGNDTYVVNSTTDLVTEGLNEGTDLVQSTALAHTLAANVENLTLLGIANLNGTGNTGNNILTGNKGNNVLNGGTGTDTASYAAAGAAVTLNLGLAGAQNTGAAGSDTLISIENLTGSGFNDTLTGNSGNNVLNGGSGIDTASYATATAGVTVSLAIAIAQNTVNAGSDTLISIENLTGSGFNDTLSGSTAANVLDGGVGADTMAGGLGNDTYVVNSTLDVVNEALNAGLDLVQSTAVAHTLRVNVENLTLLGTANINGTGNGGDNIITGNSGNNVLNGGGGNDTLLGQDGNDRFVLSAGNDVISGGAGDDTIVVVAGFGTVEIRDTLGIEFIDFSAINGPITVDLTPGSVNTIAGGTLTIFQGGAVSEPLDLFFVQDVSGSFTEDLPIVQGLVPQIVSAVQAFQPNSRFGASTFIDKALQGGDHVYRTELALTASASQLAAEYGTFFTIGNVDVPESSLEALMQATIRTAEVGWRGDSLRVALVLTDAPFHFGGDGSNSLPPNDGDAILDGSPPGNGEDYPTIEMTREKLLANDVLPVFAVTSDVRVYFDALVATLGFGEVVTLSSNSADIVTAIQAALTKATAAKIDRILGTAFNDTLTGNDFNNVLDGGAGADTMTGKLGDDTFVVGAGDVVIENFGGGADTVQTLLNNYTLGANVENLTLLGTAAINGNGNGLDNVLTGNSGINTLNGGAGNDTLIGGGGTDSLVGGTGNDTFVVDSTLDVVTEAASAGTDLVQSTATAYTLAANVENLMLIGTGNINGTGNTQNNVLTGNSGNNVLNGGTGTDTASYANSLVGVSVSLALGVAQNTIGAGSDTLVSIENLVGSLFNDVLSGNTGANLLDGSLGNDTLNGDAGNDTLIGGLGNDTLNGGIGIDTISYAGVSAGVFIDLGYLFSQFNSSAGSDTLSEIENAIGSSFNDILTGSTANNVLTGGAGDDRLNGDLGSDTLNGGAGLDTFDFDSALGATNIDTVAGFTVADDTIRLDSSVFLSLPGFGTLQAANFRSGAGFMTAADADDFIVLNTTNGQLYYDAGGNTGAANVHFATLTGVVGTVTAADFLIV